MSDNSDGKGWLSSIGGAIKDALVEDEAPKKPPPEVPKSANEKTSPKVNTPVRNDASPEDISKVRQAINARVFGGDSLYSDYQTAYEVLDGQGFTDDQRRKAAFLPIIKKNGAPAVASAIQQHRAALIKERDIFEQSLGPKGGSALAKAKARIASIEQQIATKQAELDRINRELTEVSAEKATAEQEVADAQAKETYTRCVFDAAYHGVTGALDTDEEFIKHHMKEA